MSSWAALIIKTENQSAFVRLGKAETESGSWATTVGKRLLVSLVLMVRNIVVKDIFAYALPIRCNLCDSRH